MGRKSKKNERKLEIIKAYYESVSEVGLEGSSFIRIAEKLNMNPSLISYYFMSKAEMLLCLVDYVLDKLRQSKFPEKKPIIDKSKEFLSTLDYFFESHSVEMIDSKVFFDLYALSFRDETIRQKFADDVKITLKMYEDFLKKYCDYGIINTERLDLAANYIHTIVISLENLRNEVGDSISFSDFAEEQKKQFLIYVNFQNTTQKNSNKIS